MKGSHRSNRPAAGWLGAMLVTGAISWGGLAGTAIAASDNIRIDAAPEDAYGPVGGTVTLTVSLVDDDGLPLDNHVARFYFMDGSANHPGGNGNDPDMTCSPDSSGTCQVQYTAAVEGADLICVIVASNPHGCDAEILDDPDFDDRVDLVRHVSGYAGDPEPTPTPSPSSSTSPSPEPTSSPLPTYDPSPTPSPSSSATPTQAVEPTPTPSSEPTPTPSSEPSPTPSATPGPTPSPTTGPAPTASTEPVATVTPEPTSAPSTEPIATATPSPEPTSSATPEPTQHAAPEETPESTPTPTPESTPSTDPVDATPGQPPLGSGGRGTHTGATRPNGSDESSAGNEDPDQTVALAGSGVSTPPNDGVGPGDGAILPPVVAPSGGGVGSLLSGVAAQVAATVKPAAAAAIATTFGFPLILMIAVVLFLVVQSRMDDRDPKLRLAPLTASETIVPFRDEEAL